MKTLSTLFCLFAFHSLLIAQLDSPPMKSLFDGKNLSQWVIPDQEGHWRIEEGMLIAENDTAQTGSILWTRKKYKDFVIELEFKFGEGTVDSGIFMRGENKKNPQIQIGNSGSMKRDMTASPYVTGKGYPVEAEGVKDLLKLDDWNTLRAQAIGNTYTAWLNGQQVMTYSMEGVDLKGPIGLQLHPKREMVIYYRGIKVGKL